MLRNNRYNIDHTLTTKGQNYERYVSDSHVYYSIYTTHMIRLYTCTNKANIVDNMRMNRKHILHISLPYI